MADDVCPMPSSPVSSSSSSCSSSCSTDLGQSSSIDRVTGEDSKEMKMKGHSEEDLSSSTGDASSSSASSSSSSSTSRLNDSPVLGPVSRGICLLTPAFVPSVPSRGRTIRVEDIASLNVDEGRLARVGEEAESELSIETGDSDGKLPKHVSTKTDVDIRGRIHRFFLRSYNYVKETTCKQSIDGDVGPSSAYSILLPHPYRTLKFRDNRSETRFQESFTRKLPIRVPFGSLALTIFQVFLFVKNEILTDSAIKRGRDGVSILNYTTLAIMVVIQLTCTACSLIFELREHIDLILSCLLTFCCLLQGTYSLIKVNVADFHSTDQAAAASLWEFDYLPYSLVVLVTMILFYELQYCYVWWACGIVVVMCIAAVIAIDIVLYNDLGSVLAREGYWGTALLLCFVCYVIGGMVYEKYSTERRQRLGFWKLKICEDKLELLEYQFALNRAKKNPLAVTPFESILEDLKEADLLLNSSDSGDSKTKLQIKELLERIMGTLATTDDLYAVNEAHLENEFVKSYLKSANIDFKKTNSPPSPHVGRKGHPKILLSQTSNLAAQNTLKKETVANLGRCWNVNCLEVSQECSSPLLQMGFVMLQPVLQSAKINIMRARNFLQEIESLYMNNDYHNSTHGATVCHMALCLASWSGIRNALDYFDEVCFSIAALCHDVGHPGMNNNYMVNASTALALRYNDKSVLENHHASLTFETIRNDECNIFKGLSNEVYRRQRKVMVDLILATDMKGHFESISLFRARRQLAEFNPNTNVEDMWKVASMCLKSADIGHTGLPWEQHYEWCLRVVQEFYQQGDQEASLGLEVSFLCDRSKHETDFYKSQIGFLTYVCKPLYEELAEVSSHGIRDVCLANIETNTKKWSDKEDARIAYPQDAPTLTPRNERSNSRLSSVLQYSDSSASLQLNERTPSSPTSCPLPGDV